MKQSNFNIEKTILLKKYFIQKIESDWNEKWLEKYGKKFDFEKLPSQNAFIDDLLLDIEKNLKQKIGLDATSNILISKDNIRRIFNAKIPISWHEKTRNMLAYYVGFDGWPDFELMTQAEVEKLIKTQSNFFAKNKYLIISCLILTLLMSLFFIINILKKQNNVSLYAKEIPFNSKYPISVQLYVDVDQDDFRKYKIQIEHETLQYIKLPIEIPLRKQKDKISLLFTTPSHKIIKLLKNDEVVKVLPIYVPTEGSDWMGFLRVKAIEIPKPYDPSGVAWYGARMENNSDENYLTNHVFWAENRDLKSGTLNFKKSALPNNQNVFTRMAFVKSGKFNVELKNMTLSFKAKKDDLIPEDCMSFMLHLYDDTLQGIEFYSAANCTVDENIAMGDYAPKDNMNRVNEAYKVSQINDILDDGNWHDFKFVFSFHKISIVVDNKVVVIKTNYSNFTKLREIWFIFQGNAYVDDVTLFNNLTNKLEFADNFENYDKK